MIRRRSSSPASPAAAPLPDDDDLLMEILLRLPPQPSSLPRASFVCQRWRRLASDPGFFRRFREHHRKPLLLGFFSRRPYGADFTPALEPPNRIPAARFSLPEKENGDERWEFVDCRHGLALLLDRKRLKAVVWDPTTEHQCVVDFPPGFINDQEKFFQNAAVLCSAGGHVRGDCHLGPFKLVLVRNDSDRTRAFACLYESESGTWGNIISTNITDGISVLRPSNLFGNSLCWSLTDGSILEFDVVRQSLVVIENPVDSHVISHPLLCQTVQIEENGLGLAVLTGSNRSIIQIWARKINSNGAMRWVLQKTVELDKLLPLWSSLDRPEISSIRGFDEGANAIILSMVDGVNVMVQLDSLQFRNLCNSVCSTYYPYRNFFAAGLFKGKLQEDIQAGVDHVQQATCTLEESSKCSQE